MQLTTDAAVHIPRPPPSAAIWLTTLVILLTIRLVWIQLRTFQVFPEPSMVAAAKLLADSQPDSCAQLILKNSRAGEGLQSWLETQTGGFGRSPLPDWVGNRLVLKGFCTNGLLDSGLLVRINETFFFSACLFVGLLCRLITGRWFPGLVAIVSLMSRGRVIGEFGAIGLTYFLMWVFTIWALGLIWYRMTLARTPLYGAASLVALAALFDCRFLALGVVVPLSLLPYMARKRALDQRVPESFSMLRPLPVAFSMGGESTRARIKRDILVTLLIVIAGGLGVWGVWTQASVTANTASPWDLFRRAVVLLEKSGWMNGERWQLMTSDWDAHFRWSLFGLVVTGIVGVGGRGNRYVAGSLTIIMGCLIIAACRWIFLPLDLENIRPSDWAKTQHLLIWGEPVVLAFAIVALYRIFELIAERIYRKSP